MMILGAFPVIDLMAILLAVYLVFGKREFLRESVLIGFVLWGIGIIASTEIISLCHALGFWEILIFWIMVLMLCLFVICQHWARVPVKALLHHTRGGIGAGGVRPWPYHEKVFFNRIVIFSFCLGVTAIVAPPNTFDALIYHMSRVMHWVQDHSVAYYPTNISRQLNYPVFAEYVILHFQLLSSCDQWANVVQWLAMCGSTVGVSLIARELGAARRGQILSALIAVTIPIGVLEATSSQTDYVDTLWLCSTIYFLFCWRRSFALGYALLVGASIGLGLATKGVALIYAVPFLIWMLIVALYRLNIKRTLMTGGLIVAVALVLYSGILYRNTVYFQGHAARFVSMDSGSMINERFCWEGFGANVLRNLGLHVITPSWKVNAMIKDDIYSLASFLHIDLNNKDWSFYGCKFPVIDFRGDENYLGNPLHLILFGAVLLLFAFSPKYRSRDTGFYLAACFLGWVAFSALLKWQPYHARFHLGMFVIFAPLAGFVLEKIKIRWIISGVMGTLFLSATIIVLINVTKPILGTMSIFYPQNREFLHFILEEAPQATYLEYETVAMGLKKMGCKNIGLIMEPGESEYLLWVALNPSTVPGMRIESVLVNNPSASLKYPLGDFIPDAIIAINDDRTVVKLNNNNYQVAWHNTGQGEDVSIYVKNL